MEEELAQMKEEFEIINQRALSKIAAQNPEISGTVDTEDLISASEEETEEEELELGGMRL